MTRGAVLEEDGGDIAVEAGSGRYAIARAEQKQRQRLPLPALRQAQGRPEPVEGRLKPEATRPATISYRAASVVTAVIA